MPLFFQHISILSPRYTLISMEDADAHTLTDALKEEGESNTFRNVGTSNSLRDVLSSVEFPFEKSACLVIYYLSGVIHSSFFYFHLREK